MFTKIDEIGSFWSKYKKTSIGRAIHYVCCICGLNIAEYCVFDSNGKVTLHNEPFATIDWSKGYPHFIFKNDKFNQRQAELP